MHFIPGIMYGVVGRQVVGSPRSTDPALAPQYLPETLPKVGVTEGIAEWIHGRVYIAQPVA